MIIFLRNRYVHIMRIKMSDSEVAKKLGVSKRGNLLQIRDYIRPGELILYAGNLMRLMTPQF